MNVIKFQNIFKYLGKTYVHILFVLSHKAFLIFKLYVNVHVNMYVLLHIWKTEDNLA